MRCSPHGARFVGDPVDVITGEVSDVTVDFEIAGPRGLQWIRSYQSFRVHVDRGLGWGHRHVFDWWLCFDIDGIVLDGPEGTVEFPPLWRDGERAVREGWVVERVDLLRFRAWSEGEPIRTFVRPSAQASEARLERLAHRKGGETHLQYQALREGERLVGVRDSEGWALRLEWVRGRLAAVQASGAFETTTMIRYDYDAEGNLVRGHDAYRHSFSWAYDELRRVVRRADRRGYAFVYRYDGRGRCIRAAGEDDVDAVSLVYLPDIYETRVRHEANDARWCYRYDPADRLLEIEDPYGAKRSFIYDAKGLQTGEVDPQGELWTLVRNKDGRVTSKLDPLGYLRDPDEDPYDPQVDPFLKKYAAVTASQEWGSFLGTEIELPKDTIFSALVPEELRSVLWTQAEAGVRKKIHDPQGLLLREERELGEGRKQMRRYVYDPNGNFSRVRDFDGSEWSFEYESWNQLVRYRDPLGAEFRIGYSKRDKVVRFEDPGGTVTEYEWDLCGRLIAVYRHGALRERYLRDASGSFIEHRDGAGELLIAYKRGPLDAIMVRRTKEDIEERFRRDEYGRVLEAVATTPWSGTCTVMLEHDDLNHCLRDERDSSGVRHEYVIDRLVKTEFRVGERVFTIRYSRPDGETLQIEDPTGGVHRIRQVKPGIVLSEHANGTAELSQYDERGLCLAKASTGTSGTWRRRFARSGEGHLLLREDDRRGVIRYEYDAKHRIVAIRCEGESVERFTYDLAGNLLSQPGLSGARIEEVGGTRTASLSDASVALSRGNRLYRANGDRFVYDDRHHLACRESDWGSLNYVRDAFGRLRRIERTSAGEPKTRVVWEADYDALGRRINKRIHGPQGVEEWGFYWDSNRLVGERLPDGRIRIYVYADPNALVPMLAVEYTDALNSALTDGSVYLLQTDHRGAVERVEDGSGRVVWEAVVRPFGVASVLTGKRFHQPFRLVGQYYDDETGLSVQRFRYWSAELGRFLESDPMGLGGGTNLYAWPGCPLLETDPLGLNCEKYKQQYEKFGDLDAYAKGKELGCDVESWTKPRNGGVQPHPTDPNVPGGPNNPRGRYQAGLSASGKRRLPDNWDVHHTIPRRLERDGHPLAEGIDIHHPTHTRGVQGSSQKGCATITDPDGTVRSTNTHKELDVELTRFLEDNPGATQEELDEFIQYQDWRWGHAFWENRA